MIGHQTIGAKPHRARVQGLFDDPLEREEVPVFVEKRPAAHASIEDVENRSSRCITQWPRHAQSLPGFPILVTFGGWHLFSSPGGCGSLGPPQSWNVPNGSWDSAIVVPLQRRIAFRDQEGA